MCVVEFDPEKMHFRGFFAFLANITKMRKKAFDFIRLPEPSSRPLLLPLLF